MDVPAEGVQEEGLLEAGVGDDVPLLGPHESAHVVPVQGRVLAEAEGPAVLVVGLVQLAPALPEGGCCEDGGVPGGTTADHGRPQKDPA